jgi:hypothetical protein
LITFFSVLSVSTGTPVARSKQQWTPFIGPLLCAPTLRAPKSPRRSFLKGQ